jgi:hypothetical protein
MPIDTIGVFCDPLTRYMVEDASSAGVFSCDLRVVTFWTIIFLNLII